MLDQFEGRAQAFDSPATHAFSITPADATDLSEITRAIYIGGAGNLTVVLQSDAEVTFTGLATGTVLPLRARQISATGTTATAILGMV